MPQGYTPSSTQTGTPEQLRQALGYVPARTPVGGTGSGITVIGGPSGPEISFDTSVLLAAGTFSVADEADDSGGLVVPGPAGAVGPQGPTGAPGMVGRDGTDGEDGLTIPGPPGSSGATGASGAPGSVGPPGADGEEGPEGFGIPGPTGSQGSSGATGPTGPMGPFIQGDEGPEGPEGFSIMGPAGPAGITGAAGSPGPTGAVGAFIQGMDGEEGPEGFAIPGPQGVAGAAGSTGTAGPPGIPGVGLDGEEGPEGFGVPGLVGATGATGAAGTNGTGVLVYQDGTVPGGNTIANTVTDTAFASSYTIPANSLVVGNVITVKLFGVYSTALVAPTLTLKFKVGSVTALASSAINTLVGSSTNLGWTAEATFIVTAIGVSGTFECQGLSEISTNAVAAAGLLENLTNTAAIGSIDTTGTLAVAASITWGTANASNTITLRQMVVEIETVGPSPSSAEVLISEIVTSGSQSSVIFSSIPAIYRDLKIRIRARGDTAASALNVFGQFNGDTAANYDVQFIQGSGGTPSAGNSSAASNFNLGQMPGATATAAHSSGFEALIYDYRGTTFIKQMVSMGSYFPTVSTGVSIVFGAEWRSTAAINTVKIFPSAGNFVNNSVISLYGCY